MQAHAETSCDFCQRPRSKCRRLIMGGLYPGSKRQICICDLCVALAQTPLATVAYCASCTPVNGKHNPQCPDDETGAA